MKKDVKKRWVEALRSGDYKQGKGCLHPKEDTYCCLGVLTDLFIKENPNFTWVWNVEDECFSNYDHFIHAGEEFLREEVVGWAGLDDSCPVSKDGTALADYNDGRTAYPPNTSKIFAEIADIIEKDF